MGVQLIPIRVGFIKDMRCFGLGKYVCMSGHTFLVGNTGPDMIIISQKGFFKRPEYNLRDT